MFLVPHAEINRILNIGVDHYLRLAVVSDMCRINTLTAITKAGAGHIGSSFSAMEIYVWALHKELNTYKGTSNGTDKDVILSSKGHDVPALYSVLFSLGVISLQSLLSLRRLAGLPGHPDVSTPGIEANSGSLGMGLSKACGRAWAKNLKGSDSRVFVVLGDGELQEGQIYEALLGGASSAGSEVTAIVDHNKIQSDKNIGSISYVGDLQKRFEVFGWSVARCNGNNIMEIDSAYRQLSKTNNRLKVVIADTIKGQGVEFMQESDINSKNRIYQWHAGAPTRKEYLKAINEIKFRIDINLDVLGERKIHLEKIASETSLSENGPAPAEQLPARYLETIKNTAPEVLVETFGQELVRQGSLHRNLVVLDADLAADLRLREFEKKFPDRFIEVGIAEQDMVSMAGAVNREGFIPVVNSFGAFLSSRANEQIYNNLTENSKILYVCHYAGIIPAGPGKSHQSVRDVSLFSVFPNLTIIQPANAEEVIESLTYFIDRSECSCMIRLPLGPSPSLVEFDNRNKFTPGHGRLLKDGNVVLVIAAGPMLLNQLIVATQKIKGKYPGALRLVSMSWINIVNVEWLEKVIEDIEVVMVVEDSFSVGGLGDRIMDALVTNQLLGGRIFKKVALNTYPESGDTEEVLRHHGLDTNTLVCRIEEVLRSRI